MRFTRRSAFFSANSITIVAPAGQAIVHLKLDKLNIALKATDGNEVFYKVKRTIKFKRLMKSYCKEAGAEIEGLRFMFDGVRVNGGQTPRELDLEDGDVINVDFQ
jgi:small ubiquitin-related modifier